tara:strand:- start:10716 stop:11594 length:879 start_codon:yes stop_codon:yes gene_type:complete
MAKLQSVDNLRDYAYRKLGAPKIEIQVDDTQAYDRIDDALQLFVERHFDGAEEKFVTYVFTPTDEANQYITLDDNIVAVTRIYQPGKYSSEAMSDVRYRIMFDEMFDMTKVNMAYFEITMEHLEMIQGYFNLDRTFTFNKATNRLYSHSGNIVGPSCNPLGTCSDVAHTTETDCTTALETWTAYADQSACETASGTWTVGNSILLRAWQAVIPDESSSYALDVFNDEWVKKYATAQIKQQWGANLKQFDGMPLPGGITINGQQVWDEAKEEIEKLQEEFSMNYELPVNFIVG